MDKGSSGFSDYKGSNDKIIRSEKNSNLQPLKPISNERLDHSNVGEFTKSNRPNGGGHGQDNIDYMNKNNIPYEINKEYDNGVRVGNLLTSTNKKNRSGNNHTWFPKNWTLRDICDAANYIASTYKGIPSPRTLHTGIYRGIRVTIIFGKNRNISTVFPNKDQEGLQNDKKANEKID
ncbi:MAG TPA: hypothetical protein DDW20_04260 [Firmicutes bacterium]|nr:hypothetical protein [Bacillota bacterium]